MESQYAMPELPPAQKSALWEIMLHRICTFEDFTLEVKKKFINYKILNILKKVWCHQSSGYKSDI